MEAVALLAAAAWLAAAKPAPKAPPLQVVNLKVHGFRASVWVTIDEDGTFRLREELPDDVARKPRKVKKRLGKKAVVSLVRDAEHGGFFELEERYAESSDATTSWRLELEGAGGKKAVAVYGDPPPSFQAVVDRIEELYGKPILPGLARGARRPATPGHPQDRPVPVRIEPKDDRSKEWED